MTKSEILDRIRDTESALGRTQSWKCRNDLRKYLRRLRKEYRRNYGTQIREDLQL